MIYEDYQNATFDPSQYPVYRGKPEPNTEPSTETNKEPEKPKGDWVVRDKEPL